MPRAFQPVRSAYGVLLAAALLLLLAAAPARAQVLQKEVPAPGRGLEVINKTGEKIPLDLEFIDANGKKVRLGDLFNRPASSTDPAAPAPAQHGRPVILTMMYFRCPILCPKTLEELTSTLSELKDMTVGADFDVVTVSFDPRDNPVDAQSKKTDALLLYERNTTDQIRSSWHFLTSPDPEPAQKLADAIGFPYRYLPESGEFSHPAVIFVLTPDGTVSKYLPGLQSAMGEYKVRDVRFALIEASQGRLGTWTDWLFLRCYHYDPQAGSYVVFGMRVMRIGGVLTALILGTTIGILFYNERRRRHRRLAAAGAEAQTGGGGAGVGGAGGVGGIRGTLAGHAP